MVYSQFLISAVRLFFGMIRLTKTKRKMFRELRRNPQSLAALGKAYNRYLHVLRLQQRRRVALKAVRSRFTRCPILMIRRSIGDYSVSRKAKEVLSETDIVCALERHRNGDWGMIDPEDWSKCNVCLQGGYGYAYSRFRSADGRYFCIITDYEKPKTKIVMEEELYEVQSGHDSAGREVEVCTAKKAA